MPYRSTQGITGMARKKKRKPDPKPRGMGFVEAITKAQNDKRRKFLEKFGTQVEVTINGENIEIKKVGSKCFPPSRKKQSRDFGKA